MAKKKQKKKKVVESQHLRSCYKGFKSHPPKAEFSGFTYQKISSPFEGMNENDVIDVIRKFGENFNQKFEDSFQELQARILTVDPCSLLSLFAYYDLTTSPGVNREWTEKQPILQHHVEFLQGLVLRYQEESFDFQPTLPQDFVVFRDLIKDVTRAFQMRRLAAVDPSASREQRQRFMALEDIRVHTQAVRNWGYPQQVSRIVTGLFSTLDDAIEEQLGVRVAYLVKMWFNLVNISETRLNRHRNLVMSALQAKTIESAIEKSYQAFPDITSSPEELLQLATENNFSLQNVQDLLFRHSDLRLKDIYTFTIQNFVDAYPKEIEPEMLQKIIDIWSLSFGNLADLNSEHIFLGNPVWQKPLVRLKNEKIFCPIATLFINSLTEIMEAIIKSKPELYKRYEERRGKFLEEEIYQLFGSAFPSAKVYRGSQWHDPVTNKDFENDLLVLVDSYLIIVEAKSGRVTESARRGASESLKKIINKLVVEPSLQARRFASYLKDNPGLHKFINRQGNLNEVDSSNVYEVICLNITLESLGTLYSHAPNLKKAGFISDEIDIAPTISLADIEIIFKILEGTCEKLHYLVRRTQFEQNADYSGDEIDLLAFYLDTGFNIGEVEFNRQGLSLLGMSNIFDPFFLGELPKQDTPKPRIRLTKWWKDILRQIEIQNFKGWTVIGYIILNFSYNQQLEFEKKFKKIKKIVEKFWELPEHGNICLLINERLPQRGAIVGLAYKRVTRQKRNQIIENAVEEAINISKSDRVVVIGVDIERGDYPCSIATCGVREGNF